MARQGRWKLTNFPVPICSTLVKLKTTVQLVPNVQDVSCSTKQREPILWEEVGFCPSFVGIPECSDVVVNTKLDKMSYCFACKRISKFQPTKDNVD